MFFDDKKFIAQKIKQFRKSAKMTQAELAEKVGLNEKHISHIENAKYLPSLSSFFKIVQTLNINLEDFGLNSKLSQNPYRDKLLKYIYTASESELKLFYEIMSAFEKEIPNIKKS